ncbi:MAG: hypothetical protein BWY59_01042 [Verrucomicrobia bacterium ADurb.Bin345]|nr:MAG: hypothetical protein BWY59_01042 [Verrucomicrobia bacterium ADurb.Bin345]
MPALPLHARRHQRRVANIRNRRRERGALPRAVPVNHVEKRSRVAVFRTGEELDARVAAPRKIQPLSLAPHPLFIFRRRQVEDRRIRRRRVRRHANRDSSRIGHPETEAALARGLGGHPEALQRPREGRPHRGVAHSDLAERDRLARLQRLAILRAEDFRNAGEQHDGALVRRIGQRLCEGKPEPPLVKILRHGLREFAACLAVARAKPLPMPVHVLPQRVEKGFFPCGHETLQLREARPRGSLGIFGIVDPDLRFRIFDFIRLESPVDGVAHKRQRLLRPVVPQVSEIAFGHLVVQLEEPVSADPRQHVHQRELFRVDPRGHLFGCGHQPGIRPDRRLLFERVRAEAGLAHVRRTALHIVVPTGLVDELAEAGEVPFEILFLVVVHRRHERDAGRGARAGFRNAFGVLRGGCHEDARQFALQEARKIGQEIGGRPQGVEIRIHARRMIAQLRERAVTEQARILQHLLDRLVGSAPCRVQRFDRAVLSRQPSGEVRDAVLADHRLVATFGAGPIERKQPTMIHVYRQHAGMSAHLLDKPPVAFLRRLAELRVHVVGMLPQISGEVGQAVVGCAKVHREFVLVAPLQHLGDELVAVEVEGVEAQVLDELKVRDKAFPGQLAGPGPALRPVRPDHADGFERLPIRRNEARPVGRFPYSETCAGLPRPMSHRTEHTEHDSTEKQPLTGCLETHSDHLEVTELRGRSAAGPVPNRISLLAGMANQNRVV